MTKVNSAVSHFKPYTWLFFFPILLHHLGSQAHHSVEKAVADMLIFPLNTDAVDT
jgi:hypothetical protein